MRAVLSAALAAAALTVAPAAQALERPIAFAERPAAGGALVLPLRSVADLDARTAGLDPAVRAAVARALAASRFDYRAGAVLPVWGAGAYDQVAVVGLGARGPETPGALQDMGGSAAQATAKAAGPVSLMLTGLGAGDAETALNAAIGATAGGYVFDQLKSRPAGQPASAPAPLTVVTPQAAAAEPLWRRRGAAVDAALDFARDLITEPSNTKYPEMFVQRTREAFRGVPGVTITAYEMDDLRRLGMGGIIGVGQGSTRPPRLLIVEYKGPGASGAPLAFAGKGITFDTGGISIKPAAGMERMKYDMAGAAAVTGAVLALARQGAPVHVVALAALAENMPDGNAIRPGDVLRAYNGKTMEVINTDAEGRVVLADAVSYAERRFKPAAIVDLATLTGAVRTALGDDYAGLFSNNDALAAQVEAAARTTGEPVWRLPLHPSYADDLRSDVADIKNVAEGGAAGAGIGAHFIGFFVESTPWAHLDIASKAWVTSARPTSPAGATAYGVRLLERFALDFRPVPAQAPAS